MPSTSPAISADPMRASLLLVLALLPALPAAAAAPRTHVVVIDKMKFGPALATVRPGDIILWDNRDIFRHNATATNGSFAVDLPPRSKGRTVVRGIGAVAYRCTFHPGMTGVLDVTK